MKILFIILATLFINQSYAVDPFNVYQYKNKGNSPWFEWWYYKVVLETGESFYFVYGVVNPWDKSNKLKASRSYVEMGDFDLKKQVRKIANVSDFSASYIETDVKIGSDFMTDDFFSGDLLDSDGNRFSFDVSIKKDWAYNATGWATGKSITDIEWYPAKAGAHCSGSIISNNKLYQFTDAACYQDRNWGKEFPLWWTWIVSNQFNENKDTVLAVGGGRPKYRGTKFPLEGASIGLFHEGVEYHFRPNDLDYVKADVDFGKWEIEAINNKNKIEISAFAPKEKFMDLEFMTPTGQIFHDYETLTGNVVVKLYKKNVFGKNKWELIETLTSSKTGIEFGSEKKYP